MLDATHPGRYSPRTLFTQDAIHPGTLLTQEATHPGCYSPKTLVTQDAIHPRGYYSPRTGQEGSPHDQSTCNLPDVKDVSCGHSWSVDVIAGLVQEDLEVADDGIGPLPATPHTARLGDLDPPLTGRPDTVVDVNPERKLG